MRPARGGAWLPCLCRRRGTSSSTWRPTSSWGRAGSSTPSASSLLKTGGPSTGRSGPTPWRTRRPRSAPSWTWREGYESGALKRLMGRHAVREDDLDVLLRRRVLVDLYSVLRQGVRISDESCSL